MQFRRLRSLLTESYRRRSMADYHESDAPLSVISGHPESPVVIHVPHASRSIPRWVREGILLPDADLELELDQMTDSHTDILATQAAEQAALRPTLFVNQLSRLVIDPERFPDARETMLEVGMGAVYTRTHSGQPLRNEGDDALRDELVARYFTPYAETLEQVVRERFESCGRVVIIDLHSFPRVALPYELHGDAVRPRVCLGVDDFHTGEPLLADAAHAFAEFEPAVNAPSVGTYVPLGFFGVSAAVQSIMIEVRRDQYLDPMLETRQPGVDAIVAGLVALIDAC